VSDEPTFSISDLTSYEQGVAVQRVQQACWGFERGEGLYPPMLLTVAQNGGVVLIAQNTRAEVIGYIFGYLGRAPGGPLKLCSQTMGVLPAYRNAGVATALKLAQRERALSQGLPLITWTFDPLEAPNARLNLHKLGGLVRTYKRNVYGEHFGQLNEGIPSDRFLLEWWLESERVEQRARELGRQPVVPRQPSRTDWAEVTRVRYRAGLPQLVDYDLSCDERALWVEIPPAFQDLKKADMGLARDWRAKTRAVFEHYFGRGYVAVDFVTCSDDASAGRPGYLLRRDVQTPGDAYSQV
jgi:predicted GNAT superfamily acetyltransferase